ncbi:MAG: DUF1080 domain-containing protein [Opitutaceae bacterium]
MHLSPRSLINRIIFGTVLLSLGATSGVHGAVGNDPVWISLFNARDLDGWEIKCVPEDRGKNYWRVESGFLVCDSIGDKDHKSVWLQHLAERDDFELKLKFRASREVPGNSGVQVRSRWSANPETPEGFRMEGPQIDLHPPAPWRTGLIYDETWEARRWISPSLTGSKIEPEQGPQKWIFNYAGDPNPWNDLVIRCEGTRIKTTLNGVVVSDFDGAGLLNDTAHQKRGVGMKGHIALQLHVKDELRMEFRDIFVREL